MRIFPYIQRVDEVMHIIQIFSSSYSFRVALEWYVDVPFEFLVKSWNCLAYLAIHEIKECVHLERRNKKYILKEKINYKWVSMKTVFTA